ncbi:hypothetical protein CFR73_08360 [Novacetimonas maltaceti]|nr:hypothetical protein CFR73_08360 [Novacetimonas maltaceti]
MPVAAGVAVSVAAVAGAAGTAVVVAGMAAAAAGATSMAGVVAAGAAAAGAGAGAVATRCGAGADGDIRTAGAGAGVATALAWGWAWGPRRRLLPPATRPRPVSITVPAGPGRKTIPSMMPNSTACIPRCSSSNSSSRRPFPRRQQPGAGQHLRVRWRLARPRLPHPCSRRIPVQGDRFIMT